MRESFIILLLIISTSESIFAPSLKCWSSECPFSAKTCIETCKPSITECYISHNKTSRGCNNFSCFEDKKIYTCSGNFCNDYKSFSKNNLKRVKRSLHCNECYGEDCDEGVYAMELCDQDVKECFSIKTPKKHRKGCNFISACKRVFPEDCSHIMSRGGHCKICNNNLCNGAIVIKSQSLLWSLMIFKWVVNFNVI